MGIPNTFTRVRNRYRQLLSKHYGRRLVRVCPPLPVISFTFDDFPRSALHEGGAILKRYGVRGTFYVSMGLMGQDWPAGPGFLAQDLQEALGDGHELGCH